MRVLRVAALSLLLSCSGDPTDAPPNLLEPVGDTTMLGAIWSFTFDAKDAPLIGTDTGAYRWNGSTWTALPAMGLLAFPSQVLEDARGGVVAVTNVGLFRLPANAASWEAFDGGVMKLSRLVEASDGTLYALQDRGPQSSTMRVFFRGPTDAAWTDSNVDVSVFCRPLADREGNVWCESSETLDVQRIARTTTQTYPRAYGFAPSLGHAIKTVDIDANGTHWGMGHNYSNSFGEVIAWTPSKNELSTKVTGATCSDGDGSMICDEPVTGFISSVARSPNGELYELWAKQNGETPYLMRTSPGGSWVVLGDMFRQFSRGVGKTSSVEAKALSLHVNRRGDVYLYASSLQGGAQKGASFVVRLRR
jgi:hypothetical protein